MLLPTSMLLLLWFLATISFYFILRSKSLKNTKKGTNLLSPPLLGPKGLPLIGNLHQFDTSKTHKYLYQLSKIYGALVYLKLGVVPTIVVSSPQLAKEVLRTQDHIFCSRPNFIGLQKLSYNGLDLSLAPYNEYWKEMKKICVTHLFSTKRVQLYSSIREDEVHRLIGAISSLSKKSKVIDLSKLAMSLANSIISRIGFGKSYIIDENGCMNFDASSRFQGLLKETQIMFKTFFFGDYLPFMGWVDVISGATSKLESVFRKLDEFYQEVIDEHIDELEKRTTQNNHDIIHILLQLRKDGKLAFELTLDHIKAVLMNLLVAGTETNASTIVWAMTELIKNPHIMKKVQQEVRNLLINNDQEGSNFIHEHQLHNLKYLKAVIKETYRLHPAVPLLVPRQTMQNCTLGGYQIQSGTLVFVNAWAIGRDPNVWENPYKFEPERFLDCNIDYKGQDFELIPFGSGRRICPGMILGATTVELALANLLCLFDWDLPVSMKREDIDMDTSPGITVHKKNPLCLNARNCIFSNE